MEYEYDVLYTPNIYTSDSISSNIVVCFAFSDEVMRNTGTVIQKGSAEFENKVFLQAKTRVF